MPEAILVGYDPHTADRAPVRFGVMTARHSGAPLIVGSVHDGEAGEALDHLRRELRAEGVRAECRPLAGASTPAALHHAAKSFGAALLVVGSTARGSVSRAVGGSTAERLLHGARCPVAVVPFGWNEGRGTKTIAVAPAESVEGHRAEALARSMDADLRLVRIDADARADEAADALIEVSRNVDLLVCATHGHELRRAVLLGGVARRVMSVAYCPVIVVAAGGYSRLEALLGTTPTTRVPLPTREA